VSPEYLTLGSRLPVYDRAIGWQRAESLSNVGQPGALAACARTLARAADADESPATRKNAEGARQISYTVKACARGQANQAAARRAAE